MFRCNVNFDIRQQSLPMLHAAHSLAQEAQRAGSVLVAYNEELVRQVGREVRDLLEAGNGASTEAGAFVLHACIQRDMRALVAYQMQRLQVIAQAASADPVFGRSALSGIASPAEAAFAEAHSAALSRYTQRFGALDMHSVPQPPRDLLIQVQSVSDGAVLTASGSVDLRRGAILQLKRTDAEFLIRQGLAVHLGATRHNKAGVY